MIFISQTGVTDPTREAQLDKWYIEHLRIMATVPGISSAQRFKTDMPGFPPSLAIYSVASPAVFDDPYYLSVRGMGEWLPLIDRRYYRRNLFEGPEHAPLVADDARLLIADRAQPQGAIDGVEFIWLKSVGLDRSTPYRGIAVVDAAQRPVLSEWVAEYRPVTPRMTGTAR
jgi:hypothetical protein